MAYVKTTWIDDVTPLSAANLNKIEQGVADASVLLDVGDVKWTARKYTADPAGWLIGDGRVLLATTTFTALRAALIADGNPYGADGSGNPKLPDPRGRGLIGAGQGAGLTSRALGATGGEETHLLTAAESGLRDHSHPYNQPGIDNALQTSPGAGYGLVDISSGFNTGGVNGGAQNAQNAHNNMQPWLALTLLVKT